MCDWKVNYRTNMGLVKLTLNSALEMLIVSLSLKSVKSVKSVS